MKKILIFLLGIVVIFGSIWTGAILYNELPEGYQLASFLTGLVGAMIGFMIGMFGIIEDLI